MVGVRNVYVCWLFLVRLSQRSRRRGRSHIVCAHQPTTVVLSLKTPCKNVDVYSRFENRDSCPSAIFFLVCFNKF